MSEEAAKRKMMKVIDNLGDMPNLVRISLKAKPDHIIEIMKLLEVLQKNG